MLRKVYNRTMVLGNVMTLGNFIFFDISFSTYPKHQMVMSNEHKLKWFSCSQETLGNYVALCCRNIFAYCEKEGVCAFLPPIVIIISETDSAKFFPIFLCLFSFHFICLTLFSVGLTNSYSKIANKYQLKQKI